MASPCFSCQLEALWVFSQSVVLPEEAPRLTGRETRVMPGPDSAVDTRPRGLQAGSQEELSLGRPPGGTGGRGRVCGGVCSAAVPSTGVQGRCWARRGAGVPSQARGPQLRVWLCPVEGWVLPGLCGPLGGWGVHRTSACLPPLWEVLPAPAWSPPSSLPSWLWAQCRVMLDPPAPHSAPSLCCHRQHRPPPPARPLALPGVTDAPLLACTYTLPPPRARSAACLSCTFQQPPGALKRPLRF